MNSHALFGALAGAIALAAFVPYLISIRQGKTKPEKSAWWIWSLLMVVALAAQRAQGASWSLLLTAAYLAGNLAVAYLSLRHGYGRWRIRDSLAIVAALLGVAGWYLTRNALVALLITMAVDFSGNWLIIAKSWRAPYTENLTSWWMQTVASACAVLAVGGLSSGAVIFPLYLLLMNGLTFVLIFDRRKWRSGRIRYGLRRNHS